MDLSAVFLKLLLENPTDSLEHWNQIKPSHIQEGYMDVFNVVTSYYEKYSELPSFPSIEAHLRNDKLESKVASIKTINTESISIEIIVDALINEFVQSEALSKIESLVNNITLLDAEDIKAEFNNISMELEDCSSNTGSISSMADLLVSNAEEVCLDQTYLGINNFIDEDVKVLSTELVMLGGERGSGKSIVVNNIFCNQYTMGNIGLIFSIEMRRREIYNRSLSILSGVSNTKIRSGTLNEEEYKKLAIVRRDMFLDTDRIYEEFLETNDFRKFELSLVKKDLKKDNQLIIIDNQNLTIADIDSVLTKYKSKFGSKLKTASIDYVNQIHVDTDLYDWKTQIVLSKRLKDLARKHDISIVTPYQIDKTGEARFAKGLLDAADLAFILSTDETSIDFKSTKIRSGAHYTTKSLITWDNLQIDPTKVSETLPSGSNPISMAKSTSDIM